MFVESQQAVANFGGTNDKPTYSFIYQESFLTTNAIYFQFRIKISNVREQFETFTVARKKTPVYCQTAHADSWGSKLGVFFSGSGKIKNKALISRFLKISYSIPYMFI